MGLEPLPSSSVHEPENNKAELRRSASESRSRECRFVDTPSFLSTPPFSRNDNGVERKLEQLKQTNKSSNYDNNNNNNISKTRNRSNNNTNSNSNNNNQRRLMFERRSYYDTTDFFPAEIPTKQQQKPVTIYGEIERRLNTRRFDEPSKDLETLKHILEAVKLKGLLHSSTTFGETKSRQNAVYHRRFFLHEESPVVLMKPVRPSPASSTPTNRRRNSNVSSSGEPSLSPRRDRERPARSAMRSPGRGEGRSSTPVLRRKGGPLSLETSETRRSNSPVQSPRLSRPSDPTVNRSPRNRHPTAEINQRDRHVCGPTYTEDEMSAVSESCFSISSHTDNERWRIDEYMDGKNLLERCDKLLHNIAEITANSNSNSAELQQPSPVSVLDPSFYKEDESSPSPVKKRIIDFKDQSMIELEDGLWSPSSSTRFTKLDNDLDSSEDSEFSYVSEVLRASNYLPEDNNLFFLLEKQVSFRGIGRDKSKGSILQRKLIFDTIAEILDRNRQLPPWKPVSTLKTQPIFDEIWSEFQKIQEAVPSDDLVEVICGVLKKDLARDSVTGWDGFPIEMSEAVLDIERLIFKDLIGETIRDLAFGAGKSKGGGGVHPLCRKLVF
ncbi:hypothetical protein RND81_02G010500 [Saponaria officinalis]